MTLTPNEKARLPAPPKQVANMIQNPENYLIAAGGKYVVGVAKRNHLELNYSALNQL
jgi:hypothetical protein